MKEGDRSLQGLSWRTATPEDIPQCFKVDPAIRSEQLLGQQRALSVWKGLAAHASLQSAVVETEEPVFGSRIVAFGASVFVSNQFAQGETMRPAAGLLERILGGIAGGQAVLLSPKEIRRDNTSEGLNVIILSAAVRPDLQCRPGFTERLRPFLAGAFLSCQSGYRLRRILLDVTDAALRQRVEEMRSWRILEYGPVPGSAMGRGEGLAVMELRDALVEGESLPALLFNYQEPRLRLTTVEQGLLQAAVTGLTDREISQQLKLSRETIKSRWMTILRKAETIMPDIFHASGDQEEEKENRIGRGWQRRHHLLNFLRQHPEELRPFDWSTKTKGPVIQ